MIVLFGRWRGGQRGPRNWHLSCFISQLATNLGETMCVAVCVAVRAAVRVAVCVVVRAEFASLLFDRAVGYTFR